MNIFKRFRKSISLRIVNWLGLSIMFASLLVSYSYVKKELSYDRYHVNADRMVRLSLQEDDNLADIGIWGNDLDDLLGQIPEIEQIVKFGILDFIAVLDYRGEKQAIKYYSVGPNFFDVFDIPWVQGEKNRDWRVSNQVVISESLARQILGDSNGNIGEINIREVYHGQVEDTTVYVSGIFKDIPETSHFHTDIFSYRSPETMGDMYCIYLLLKDHTSIPVLEQKITQLIERKGAEEEKVIVSLMPITDIHFHSHTSRELEAGGNIHYIYFVVGANLLLLVVVLFNLWLNASLIFSYHRRYYQLLRLNGASSFTVAKDETLLALVLGFFSVLSGMLVAFYASSIGHFRMYATPSDIVLLFFVFLILIVLLSLLPVAKNISSTLFLNTSHDLRPVRFSHTNVKYMLTAQYTVVMIVVILTFGITKQMGMVKDTQIGGNKHNILVIEGMPDQVKVKNALLKAELLKRTEIEAVTTSRLLPGKSIFQGIKAIKEGDEDGSTMSVMVVGEDFLPFFNIKLLAGRAFSTAKFDYATEEAIFFDWLFKRKRAHGVEEEYIINRKAMIAMGFNSPDDAIGQMLQINAMGLDYINRGVIVGVTDDFNYTGFFETSEPILMMQRLMLQDYFMVRLDPSRFQQSLDAFLQVWDKVNPEYPANYVFMSDVFNKTYRYELYAERLVYIFSVLCLVIASLGLIIFMAFIVKRRTKEIGIRKVNGAGISDILVLLNTNFIRWIALAFVIAVPVAWYVMHRWLEHFAYRISLSWWIFVLAGLLVMLFSLALVSLQSWRAATANPVETIKTE